MKENGWTLRDQYGACRRQFASKDGLAENTKLIVQVLQKVNNLELAQYEKKMHKPKDPRYPKPGQFKYNTPHGGTLTGNFGRTGAKILAVGSIITVIIVGIVKWVI